MPLTAKGEEILESMEKSYGSKEKAEQVLYASKNKGKITGIDQASANTGTGPVMGNPALYPNGTVAGLTSPVPATPATAALAAPAAAAPRMGDWSPRDAQVGSLDALRRASGG